MKKAIITGASSGLGLEIGNQLQNKNYEIINISRRSSQFENIYCDLSSDKDLEKTIIDVKENHNNFNLIILNAGIMPKSNIGQINFNIDDVRLM